jgi:hypothetical protein
MFGKSWARKWVPLFFLWCYCGRGMNLTIYLHPVLSLRMSGALYTSALLRAFMARKRTSLFLFIYFFLRILLLLDDTNFGSSLK